MRIQNGRKIIQSNVPQNDEYQWLNARSHAD